MKYIMILCTVLALCSCQTNASGTNHGASIVTNILSLEF